MEIKERFTDSKKDFTPWLLNGMDGISESLAGEIAEMLGEDIFSCPDRRNLKEELMSIPGMGEKKARSILKLVKEGKSQKEVFGWEGGALHDPITVAYLIDPSVLTVKPMHSEIDIRSTQSYGRTNCDYFGYQKLEPTADVAIDIDVEKFWDIIEDGLRRY